MAVSIPENAVRAIAPFFSPRTFQRALAYARDGRVQVVKSTPWPVVAHVRGNFGYVVTVDYNPGSRDSSGQCSCPVAVDCKHAAATALVVLAEQTRSDGDARRADENRAVGDWLAGLGMLHETRADSSRPTHRVAYVVEADDRDDLVPVIAVYRCAQLKRGGLGRGTRMSTSRLRYGSAPTWLATDDLRRILSLCAVCPADDPEVTFGLDRIEAELLRDLCDSGRLFWNRIGLPLSYGDVIAPNLAWVRESGDAGLVYRLGLEGGLRILPTPSPHYVDIGRGTLGPVELGLSAPLARRLLTGPVVPEAMLDTVDRSLSTAVGAGVVPRASPSGDAPAAPEVRPRLELSAGPRSGLRVHAEAVYDDARFPLTRWEGDRAPVRDLAREGQLDDRLATLLDRAPHGLQAIGPRETLEDARYVAETLVPTLVAEGWECDVDDSFPVAPPLVRPDWVEDLRPLPDSGGWFALELGVRVGGRVVSLLPILLQAIRDGQLHLGVERLGQESDSIPGLTVGLPGGERVFIPSERLRRWLGPLLELQLCGVDDSGELIVPDYVAPDVAQNLAPGPLTRRSLAAVRERLAGLIDLPPRREGKAFVGVLRSYQRQGLAWLRFLHDAGYGGLLADDMGLGKTVQLLAFLDGLRAGRKLSTARPALVVAPRSVVSNWASEAARFSPRLSTAVHLGPDRKRDPGAIASAHVIITSYQTLLRDIDTLGSIAWSTAVFDEAQAMKNPATKLWQAARSLRAGSRFCVTGTPVENHLEELWAHLDVTMPGLLGEQLAFRAAYRRPIEKHGATEVLRVLRKRVRPFLLRRTKASVDLELPPKIEVVERVDLGSKQRDLYESLRLAVDEDVRRALRDRGVSGSSLVILDALLKLRQTCCDPRLVKIERARAVSESAKLDHVMAMLEQLMDSGRYTLVFSQFTSMLRLIEAECHRANIAHEVLTGKTRRRDEAIARFQAGDVPVFLISLKAGGVGLNLTRADTVIHYDPWWNPAVEAQATDRAHRIGQDKTVMIYKLVASGTLEERICTMQREKARLTDAVLEGDGSALSAEDLAELYRAVI